MNTDWLFSAPMNIKNINSFAGPHTHTHTFTHTPNKHNTHTYTNTHTYSTAVTEIVLHSLISRSKAIQQGLFVMCHFYNHCNPFNMSLMYYSIWCPGGGGEWADLGLPQNKNSVRFPTMSQGWISESSMFPKVQSHLCYKNSISEFSKVNITQYIHVRIPRM